MDLNTLLSIATPNSVKAIIEKCITKHGQCRDCDTARMVVDAAGLP